MWCSLHFIATFRTHRIYWPVNGRGPSTQYTCIVGHFLNWRHKHQLFLGGNDLRQISTFKQFCQQDVPRPNKHLLHRALSVYGQRTQARCSNNHRIACQMPLTFLKLLGYRIYTTPLFYLFGQNRLRRCPRAWTAWETCRTSWRWSSARTSSDLCRAGATTQTGPKVLL